MALQTFPKLRLKQFPQIQDRETSEAKFWRRNFPITGEDKLFGAPTSIHFDPSGSGNYLVTGSTRVSLYDGVTDKVQRAYSRFDDDAFSGRFRKDGKLLVAGDKSGFVKVFDVSSKSILRQMKRHTAAVRSTAWTSDGLHLISGSDDSSVNVWDLASGEITWSCSDSHSDYVRSVEANPMDPHLFVSGGYDKQVRLWDTRQSRVVLVMNQGSAVSCTISSPLGSLLMSSGGNEIKVWDLASGGRVVHTFCNHQKNITGLALNGTGSRLLSCGLDGHVKVYNFQSLQVVHGIKFGSPLVSVGVSRDCGKLVVGYANGGLEVRTKVNSEVEEGEGEHGGESQPTTPHPGRHYKGAGLAVDAVEHALVETERTMRLKPYEVHLKKFNYQSALDAALRTRNPLVVVTVLEELCRRSGLVEALSGRDEVTLEPILAFAARYVSSPRYSRLLVQVTHVVLDLYGSTLGHSDSIDELFLKLQRQVKVEVGFQRQIMRVMGSLDCIIGSALNHSEHVEGRL